MTSIQAMYQKYMNGKPGTKGRMRLASSAPGQIMASQHTICNTTSTTRTTRNGWLFDMWPSLRPCQSVDPIWGDLIGAAG